MLPLINYGYKKFLAGLGLLTIGITLLVSCGSSTINSALVLRPQWL